MAEVTNRDSAADPHGLARFVQAQADDYERALTEIKAGRKRSHWMWYIFPQIDGLGFSSMSRSYSIKSIAEAKAYLSHPVLGPGWWSAPRRPSVSKGERPSTSSAPRTT